MLKLFRQYMNYILAVIVTVLMIAFLIQPTLSIFTPQPGKEPVGTIDGQEITRTVLHQAAVELELLESLAQLLRLPLLVPPGIEEPIQWMLAKQEAQSLGLSSSHYESQQLLVMADRLRGQDGWAAAQIALFHQRNRVTSDMVHALLGQRLTYQKYLGLIRGLDYPSLPQQIIHLQTAMQFYQAGYSTGSDQEMLAMQGTPRLSDPLRRRIVLDQFSTVTVEALAIDSQRYLHRVEAQPSDAQLQQFFEQYKDNLPGMGEPDGFGYRLPDAVKIEYLKIPFNRVLDRFPIESINEADAMDYYDSHHEDFMTSGDLDTDADPSVPNLDMVNPDDRQLKPYESVRQDIKQRLRDRKAKELANRIIKTAQAALLEQARELQSEGGYYTVPKTWRPLDFEMIADDLEKQFGLRPQVRRYDDRWLTLRDLISLPGISRSAIQGRQPQVTFIQYVTSVREIQDPQRKENPLASYRLQIGLPSVPLHNAQDGDGYIFRLIDVQRSHAPASWENVREQLIHDVQRMAAYELLKQDVDTWQARVVNETLSGLAASLGEQVLRPAAFPRRQPRGQGWVFRLDTPVIEGIGRSQPFVDAVFELAQTMLEAGGVDKVPEALRVLAIPVDRDQRLVLVKVKDVSPMSQSEFNSLRPSMDAWVGQALIAETTDNPISVDALSLRMDFDPTDEDDETHDHDAEFESRDEDQTIPGSEAS